LRVEDGSWKVEDRKEKGERRKEKGVALILPFHSSGE